MITTAHVDGADDAALVVAGTGPAPADVSLTGPRAHVTQTAVADETGWHCRMPLRAARWGGPPLPLPTGDYRLTVDGVVQGVRAQATVVLPTLRVRLTDGLVRVGPPIDPAYDSGEGQDALERRYATRPGGVENAVFFEAFYGRIAGCNPLAIDRELARVAPGITRYWSVVDLSVPVPEGAIAVVDGTPEWWRARGTARLLVVNDWLRRRFARRAGQRVLQTWHGTPLKRLALHRPGFALRRRVAVVRESRRWDVLLAQNPYAARILRSAYGFGGSLWVEGYPRNDLLVGGDGAHTRRALGIDPADRVVLYAPTWRDDREEIVDFFDPARLAERTGAVVLVRGHTRTLAPGHDAAGARVIDVTAYPDITPLLLVADALVTDYSSVMFDFTVTGKPLVLFTPDLAHYRGELRGFSFDLAAHAPGPLTTTEDELVAALTDADAPQRYADRYARWQARFNSRDDGRAAERVVARILDQGLVER
ncbi:CDP-glycerol glycerophosphotransferase family protein [Microbacterium sp.]|uniref:CDP-glycerol glycerophosphotransferase family protein n=1 Tax=Microbacterium sp. TaxID=51671 RepID=UPI003A8954FF